MLPHVRREDLQRTTDSAYRVKCDSSEELQVIALPLSPNALLSPDEMDMMKPAKFTTW